MTRVFLNTDKDQLHQACQWVKQETVPWVAKGMRVKTKRTKTAAEDHEASQGWKRMVGTAKGLFCTTPTGKSSLKCRALLFSTHHYYLPLLSSLNTLSNDSERLSGGKEGSIQ